MTRFGDHCGENGLHDEPNIVTSCSHIAIIIFSIIETWWRHQMEAFSTLLALCAENSPVSGEFPAQRPVTQSFDVFFDLRLNKRLSKQSCGWWFDTLSRPLWRHRNDKKTSGNGDGAVLVEWGPFCWHGLIIQSRILLCDIIAHQCHHFNGG